MRPCAYTDVAEILARQLPKGVFLSVGGETPNVMTVGWGGLTYFWRRPVFIAPIRPQRFTYPILQETLAFTISIPTEAMQEQIRRAGTWSGRDGDKFARLGLTPEKATQVDAPIIAECPLHLECRVLATNDFQLERTNAAIVQDAYPAHDFHTLFYGEIVACYER